eukprot:4213194-Prymnesium_polylepis.1
MNSRNRSVNSTTKTRPAMLSEHAAAHHSEAVARATTNESHLAGGCQPLGPNPMSAELTRFAGGTSVRPVPLRGSSSASSRCRIALKPCTPLTTTPLLVVRAGSASIVCSLRCHPASSDSTCSAAGRSAALPAFGEEGPAQGDAPPDAPPCADPVAAAPPVLSIAPRGATPPSARAAAAASAPPPPAAPPPPRALPVALSAPPPLSRFAAHRSATAPPSCASRQLLARTQRGAAAAAARSGPPTQPSANAGSGSENAPPVRQLEAVRAELGRR